MLVNKERLTEGAVSVFPFLPYSLGRFGCESNGTACLLPNTYNVRQARAAHRFAGNPYIPAELIELVLRVIIMVGYHHCNGNTLESDAREIDLPMEQLRSRCFSY
jgi:hypothetical protein